MTIARRYVRPPDHPGAEAFVPEQHTLSAARASVSACRGCPIYRDATQGVFGDGDERARVMLIGEQPGDSEDLAGKPFVGPAGRLLDEALLAAGIPRDRAYVTNVVKHFKYARRGKRRIHDKPNRYEVDACRPWLDLERELVRPEIVVLLGATAARSLLGWTFRVTEERGVDRETALAAHTFATVHPASVLRARDDEARAIARDELFRDLRVVGECYQRLQPWPGESTTTSRSIDAARRAGDGKRPEPTAARTRERSEDRTGRS